ncbi:choice-of-anchor D domain-containing protein [Flavimarina sp. Hel_I_48]|uniref:Ig-like domain-containing protein n=1 Tax=Flavimarina sp. Hel_I_48 TaxID=1392488 RepID=UPI0004DF19F8|nr:choice-of-anchor D domain-containing protein [Flavimarina sp. Hel_I_48]
MKQEYLNSRGCCVHARSSLSATAMTILTAFIFLFMGFQQAFAQKPVKLPGEIIVCPAGPDDMNTQVNIPKTSSGDFQRTMENAATAEFDITFGPGAQANPEASAAFQFALDIWATQVVSAVPIKVYADFADLGQGVLASAGPAYNVTNFPGAPEQDVLYPAALANSIAGEALFPDEDYDLLVNLGNGIPWYFGTDGNTPAGLYDFVTVALHEAGHGLGFTTVRSYNAGTGSLRSGGNPSVYGLFMELGDGTRLLDLADPSTELGSAFTGGDLYMGGTFAVAALAGERPELYAPSTWQGGSSLAHWDEVSFPAGDPNSLMTPQVGSAESNFDIGDITRGLFKDMGWVINDEDAPSLIATPQSLTEELFVGDTLSRAIEISNISDDAIDVTVNANSDATVITSFDPESFTIASAGTNTFNVNLDASGLVKGIYNDTIFVSGSANENQIAIPVTVRVLDGTETPQISVSPESFDETIEQFQIITRELSIANNGDEDLTYSIEVVSDSTQEFDSRVAISREYIANSGSKTTNFNTNTTLFGNGQLVKYSGGFEKIVTSLYATDFEEFTTGDILGQLGWSGQYPGNWVVSTENPENGNQHFRGISDGLGSTRAGSVLAISPTITPGDEPFMVASATINIQGEGVTWEVIPQSPTANSVNTRLRFNPDRSIDVLTESDFVPITATTPEGYFDLRIVVDKDDSTFSIFFDEELVFSGQGFAPEIEQVVILSNMEVTGSTFDMDDFEITDGDPSSFFLSVSPSAGTVPFGTTSTVNVKFDARTLNPGSYEAALTVSSNDLDNPQIKVPVALTVLQPPTIEVAPDSLSASVNVITETPATAQSSFTISNSGESPLDFTASPGSTSFTPPAMDNAIKIEDLDMANYGVGNTEKVSMKIASTLENLKIHKNVQRDAVTYSDSISYDSGVDFPDDFVGFQTAPLTSAMKFVTEGDFTLSAIRNAYRTEAVSDPTIILQVYRGGDASPNDGELLITQTFTQSSADGIVVANVLDEAQTFTAGETFWIVYQYPDGIAFPQGYDSAATIRPNTYFASSDGGATYVAVDFAFFTRALSGGRDGYIALEPSSGTVAPGESLEVNVTFDGTTLANGVYDTDIVVSSNDPITPEARLATTFEVSGQISEIAISDEFLLFNNVFLGSEAERTFTIDNLGLDVLTIESITSDNPDFSVEPAQAAIAANGSLDVVVTFAPSATGSINGILTINSDAPENDELQIVVNGVGVDPPVAVLDPTEVSETTDAGTTIDSEITLKNEGNSPLIFSFPDLAVANALADPDVQLNNTEIIDFGSANNLDKGATDPRRGNQIEYSVGTDTGFGYTWIDSDEDGGPVYAFNDISGSGTAITSDILGDGSTQVAIGFPFEFYGVFYDNAFINANGFVAFQEPTGVTYTNQQIPTAGGINNMIAALWDDLEPQNFNGAVHYQAFENRFIIQWTTVSKYSGTAESAVTFQIVLNSDGNIDLYYDNVENAGFLNSATVGIENADGTQGAQVAFNTSYIKDNLALRFVKPEQPLTSFISNVKPLSGVVAAGGSRQLTVTLDATGLNDGVYFDNLEVSSNDPINSPSTLFELTVIGYPEITITPDTLNFGGLYVNQSTSADFLIENTGSKTLEISELSNGNSDFVLDTVAPFSLKPDQSLVVGVTFTPSVIGSISDEITITSNDAFDNSTETVLLSGIGIDPPVIAVTPEAFDLTVNKGDSISESITINNNGGSVLNYSVTPPYFGSTDQATATPQVYPQLEFAKIRSKEAGDTRKGPQFMNASGGPGTFGYTWIDNNSGGPAYDYVDISESGTPVAFEGTAGEGNASVELPFEFNFFGNIQDSVTIAANGFLTFAPVVGSNFSNAQIPSTTEPNNIIAAMWSDLEPQNGTGVFYQASEEYFIVQYEAVPGFGFPPFLPIPDPVTFQVILYPNGTIKTQYRIVDSSIATSSTVGLEGPDGTSGLQVLFNTEYLTNELAITFTPPLLGSIEAGESVEIPITFSAEDLEGGQTYEGNITIGSNDPVTPIVQVPVSLEVLEVPEVTGFVLYNADLNEEIGPLMDGDVINLDNYPENAFSVVANVGVLDVSSVVFGFNDNPRFKVENNSEYTINGNEGAIYMPVAFPLGENTITATPYSGKNGTGQAGNALTVTFEVIQAPTLCFGESVTDYSPGFKKDGSSLPASRSNPERALGMPMENDNYNYVSLGFGGSIVIELGCEVMDMAGNDLLIVETGFNDLGQPCETYPEKAMIEASLDGETWSVIGTGICRDGEVDLADGGLSSARFIRVTDMSNPADFTDGAADGYDLDGILVINTLSDEDIDILLSIENQINRVANAELDINMYPNPVSGYLNLAVKGNGGTFKGQLFNLNGANVINRTLDLRPGVNQGVMDMTGMSQGVYFLQLTNEEGAISSKIQVVKK